MSLFLTKQYATKMYGSVGARTPVLILGIRYVKCLSSNDHNHDFKIKKKKKDITQLVLSSEIQHCRVWLTSASVQVHV